MPALRDVIAPMSLDETSDSSLSSIHSFNGANDHHDEPAQINGWTQQAQPTLPSRKRSVAAPSNAAKSKKKVKVTIAAKIEERLEPPDTDAASNNWRTTKAQRKKDSNTYFSPPIETPIKEEEKEQQPELTNKSPRSREIKFESIAQEEEAETVQTTKRSRKRGKTAVAEKEEEKELDDKAKPPKKSRNRTTTVVVQEDQEQHETEEAPKKLKRHRKTKEEKEAEAMPLAARALGLRMYIGAHVSGAKGVFYSGGFLSASTKEGMYVGAVELRSIPHIGVHNAVTNCVHIGGNAFALFLKSQRKWENPPLQDEHRSQFADLCGEHKYDAASHILPHGSYLVNLAQKEPDKAKQAYDAFLDDLNRCEALGIKLYNFHPGNTGPSPRASAISRIADALNRAHAATRTVKPVLENMASHGNVIGGTFEDLRDIINQVEDKSRIGVCIDTCHSFVAGYDLRTPEAFKATLNKFDEIVGIKYLSALHLNDSKAPFSSHRDLHQNIGLGFLGLRAFHNVMNEPRFEGLPMVLETPIDRKDDEGKVIEDKSIWAKEIKLLESLIGMDAEGEEFRALETELAAKGAEERKKYQEAHERKLEKDRKAAEKGKGRGGAKKKKKGEDDSESGNGSGSGSDA